MIRKIAKLLATAACVLCLSGNAFAVTVGGNEYTEFLTLEAEGNLGYWVSMKKFYTYHNMPHNVNVTFIEDALEAYEDDIDKYYTMGTSTTAHFDTTIATGVLQLLSDSGQVLLSANYASNGIIDSTRAHGAAGGLSISGLYNVTGGLFSNLGLVTGTIYAQFVYDTVIGLGHNDIHVTDGTVHLFRQGGATEIPEPTTMILLASSLLGAARFRSRKSE